MNIAYADDDFIRNQILGNGQLVQIYPVINSFRAQLQALDKKCTACGGSSAIEKRIELMNTIRQTLATFPADAKQVIRTQLGVDQIKMPYYTVDGSGKKDFKSGVV